MLAEMGFEPTLCQKAVGMFGDDMGAAVAWLTDDQAQHTLPISHHISPYLPISPYISLYLRRAGAARAAHAAALAGVGPRRGARR